MLDIQTNPQTDPHHGLTADLFRVAIFKLHNEVPPPATKDPALIEQFVNAGIAEIASMVPANADEVSMAVRVLSADAQASDCIRHARMIFNDSVGAMKCHAQANHYKRTANASRALLLRVQAVRHKREAVPATCSSDAWTIHATEALLIAAAAGDAIPPLPREPPLSSPPPEPPPPSTAADDDDDNFARYDIAEQYAVAHPRHTAEIRVHAGIPPTTTGDPPEPDLVQAIVASTSPILCLIDQEYGHLFRT